MKLDLFSVRFVTNVGMTLDLLEGAIFCTFKKWRSVGVFTHKEFALIFFNHDAEDKQRGNY